jgi:hypothetical protein
MIQEPAPILNADLSQSGLRGSPQGELASLNWSAPAERRCRAPRIGLTGLSKLHDFLGDTRCAFGIRKIATTLGVGTGAAQPIKAEMARPSERP